jgi:hypothetical protein
MYVTFECNFPVIGNPLGNVDCLPGTQVPRGFYLVEFKLNYSLTLESEKRREDRQVRKDAKIANWKACQLAHWLVRSAAEACPAQCVALRLGKPAEATGIPLWSPPLPTPKKPRELRKPAATS